MSESENNNSRSAANALVSGSAIKGQLHSETDIDYYSFAATSAGSISIDFDPTVNSSYTEYYTVSLMDSSGNVLGSQDVGKDTKFSAGVTSAGTYYVAVDAYTASAYSTYHDSGEYSLTASITSGSTANIETESNNTRSTADALVSGSAIKGQLHSETDIDYYSFAATSAGSISIDFDPTVNSSYTEYYTVSLMDSSGNVLGSQDVGKDTKFSAGVTSAGTYYVAVDAYQSNWGSTYHDAGEYNLKVTAGSYGGNGFSEVEDNGEFNSANSIIFDNAIKGSIASRTDNDFYYFSNATKEQVTVKFDPGTTTTASTHVIELYEGSSLLTSRSASSVIEFSVSSEPNKILYAVVKAGDKLSKETYNLTVSGSAKTKSFETENNDTTATADVLQSGIPITANLKSTDDIDYFVIDVAKVGTLNVDFDPSSEVSLSTHQITVFDSEGNSVLTRHTGSDTSLEASITKAGKFYIAVQQSGTAYSDIEYSVKASGQAITQVPDGSITGTNGDDFSDGTLGDDIFVISSGFDVLDGKSGSDSLYLSTQKSSVSLKTNGLGYQADFDQAGYLLSGFNTNLYNIEKIYFTDEVIDLNLTAKILAVGKAEVLSASQLNQSVIYDPKGITKIADNASNDADSISFFSNKSTAQITTLNEITEIKTLNLSGGSKVETLYVSGIEELSFLDQTVDLNSQVKSFVTPENATLKIEQNNQDVILTAKATSITSDATGTTLYVFANSSNYSVNQVGANHYLYEIDSSSNKIRTVEISGVSNVQFTDKIHVVETDYTIDLSGIPNSIKEGDTFDLKISLTGKPSSEVVLGLAENTKLEFSGESVQFSTENWMTPQTLKVMVLQDDDKLNDDTSISFSFNTADENYSNQSHTQMISIIDDDNYGSISGTIYNDFNKDADFDFGEGGLSSWTVYLDQNKNGNLDASEVFTLTNNLGGYTFSDLDPGTYTIAADSPRGWVNSFSLANQSPSFLKSSSSSEVFSNFSYPNKATSLSDSVGSATGIEQIRSDVVYSNFKGQGQTVVIIDDGIQSSHPNFSGRVVYQYDFADNDSNAYYYNNSHGTHVAGTAAGKTTGIAPEADIIMLKVFGDGAEYCRNSDVEDALNWVIDNCDTYNIASVNLSLGSGNYNYGKTDSRSDEFLALKNLGVFVAAASGNSYYEYGTQGVGSPSSDPNVFSVGAVWTDDRGRQVFGDAKNYSTSEDAITVFSQRSTSLTDVFAPGGGVYSSVPGGQYVWGSGTSMASPQVAGFAAIAQQAALEYLGRKLTVDELSKIITDNADIIYDGDDENDNVINTYSYYKRINFEESLKAIEAMSVDSGVVATIGTDDLKQIDLGFVPISGFNGTSSNDSVAGTSSADIMRLLDGDDDVSAGAGNDDIYLGDGDDTVNAGSGKDIIYGGNGDDTIDGGSGDDTLYAGAGSDTLTGGIGADKFIFYQGDGKNIITDFNEAEDVYSFYNSDGTELSGTSISKTINAKNEAEYSLADGTSVTLQDNTKNSTTSHTVTTSVVTRDGSKISDADVVMSDGTNSSSYKSSADGSVSGELASGSSTTVTGSLAYSSSTKAISSQDALDALKLSVGLSTSAGTKTAFDFISADFNQDGKVSSQDALAILKNSVGLPTTEQAKWVFVDTNGDYSGVSKSNTSYTEGVTIADLSADTTIGLTGILIGDVNDSYSGLIA
ncbi:S8 family serine peptidase [Rhodobacteraceae bacterium]|nr:S8 family serine peptidase [Paracoccaceae bacterium]